MAYNEQLADRIRFVLQDKKVGFAEKKMMGGLCFMVDDKMCIGIVKEDLMARIDPDIYEIAIKKPGCRPMDFTGRPMKGYVFVEPASVDMEVDLNHWIQLCLDFNPKGAEKNKFIISDESFFRQARREEGA